MSQFVPGLPSAGEYPPYAVKYVETVTEEDLVGGLKSQIAGTLSVLRSADPERARSFRYAPGKWTLNQVLGHIADTERIFAYRALRIARGDTTPLAGFEQDDYVANGPFLDCSLEALLLEYRGVRAASISFLTTLQPEAWMRQGTASGYPVTVRGLAALMLGHERYHLRIVREKYV